MLGCPLGGFLGDRCVKLIEYNQNKIENFFWNGLQFFLVKFNCLIELQDIEVKISKTILKKT